MRKKSFMTQREDDSGKLFFIAVPPMQGMPCCRYLYTEGLEAAEAQFRAAGLEGLGYRLMDPFGTQVLPRKSNATTRPMARI